MKRKVKINQIPLSFKEIKEINDLVVKLRKDGYKVLHGLDDVYHLEKRPVSIVVSIDDKEIFQSNVTCMASWCNSHQIRPLSIDKAINYYDELFIKNNEDLYNELLEEGDY